MNTRYCKTLQEVKILESTNVKEIKEKIDMMIKMEYDSKINGCLEHTIECSSFIYNVDTKTYLCFISIYGDIRI